MTLSRATRTRDLNDDNDFADANEVVYYHSSTLFSVYALSDASETVIERYRYDAYGACTVLDADGSVDAAGLSDVKNPYTFTARRLDAESGLMRYRFRDYSPSLGRFAQRDPIGYMGGLNSYCAYFIMRMHTDPLGLLSEECTYTGRSDVVEEHRTVFPTTDPLEGSFRQLFPPGKGGLLEYRLLCQCEADCCGYMLLTTYAFSRYQSREYFISYMNVRPQPMIQRYHIATKFFKEFGSPWHFSDYQSYIEDKVFALTGTVVILPYDLIRAVQDVMREHQQAIADADASPSPPDMLEALLEKAFQDANSFNEDAADAAMDWLRQKEALKLVQKHIESGHIKSEVQFTTDEGKFREDFRVRCEQACKAKEGETR